MNAQDLERALAGALEDGRLSGGESKALGALLADLRPDAQRTAAIRSQAFALARGALGDPQSRAVLEWLEGVVRLLHPVEPGGATVGEASFAPGHDLCARVLSAFEKARRSADVCVFTVTDDRITEAILSAHRRGVRVRVVTDDDKRHDLGSDVGRLSAAGVPVRVDRTEYHMHHKFALFDGEWLLNGSFNWTRSAGRNNHENFVITNDPNLVRAFQETFDQLWQAFG